MNTNTIRNNKGQALLFVVVALTISTVVGVAVATRTLSTSKRISTTDTYSRVYYAAEAGIERYAGESLARLREMSAGAVTPAACPTPSVWDSTSRTCSFMLGSSAEIETKTTVKIEEVKFTGDVGGDNYTLNLSNGSTSTVNLSGPARAITLCWESAEPTALYFRVYSSTDTIGARLVAVGAGNPAFIVSGTDYDTPNAPGRGAYTKCYEYTPPAAPLFLDATALGGDATLAIFPSDVALFPLQGFKITSRAELNQNQPQVQVTQTIVAFRSYEYVPSFYNSAVYTGGVITTQ